MSFYESVFIARQDVSSTQVEQLADSFAEILSGLGAEVKLREYWGLRNMAYRIKKNRKGHYVMFHIDGPSAAILEMERNMRLNEDILRYMTIRMDELPEGPSVIMQAKSERNDRGDRGGPRRRDDRPGGERRDDRPGGDRRPPRGPEGDAPAATEDAAETPVVAPVEAAVETPVEAPAVAPVAEGDAS